MAAHILTALRQERENISRARDDKIEYRWDLLEHMLDYSIPANALDFTDDELLRMIIKDQATNTLDYTIRNLIDKYYDRWGRLGQPSNHEEWIAASVTANIIQRVFPV